MANFHDEANGIKTTVGLIQGLIAAVLAGLLLWIGSEITDLGKKIERLEVLYDSQIDLAAQRERLAKVERDQIIVRFSGEVDALEAQLSATQDMLNRIWPRLRTNSDNISLLAETMNQKHNGTDIQLKRPEAF